MPSFDGERLPCLRQRVIMLPAFLKSPLAALVGAMLFIATLSVHAWASAPAEAKKPAASAAIDAPLTEVEGFARVDFARLSAFQIDTPAFDPNAKPDETLAAMARQIPEPIKRLDGRRAQVIGFMLPVKMEGTLVTEFLLLRDQMMCCYGIIPRINDWVVVRAAKPVRFAPDIPITVRGTLKVGPAQEQGFVTAIYTLEDGAILKI